MADYRTHVLYGTLVGAGTAVTAKLIAPSIGWQALPLGAFFGFVGGMIPDVDHDTGHALDTIAAILSTFLPILTLAVYLPEVRESWTVWSLAVIFPCHYLLHWGFRQLAPWNYAIKGVNRTYAREATRAVLVAAICAIPALFLFRRLPLGFLQTWGIMIFIAAFVQLSLPMFRGLTVHRGSIHSVPIVLLYGELVYLYLYRFPFYDRLTLALCALMGALSHLLLDEWYSVDFDGKQPRFKRSFGTAFSFWKKDYKNQMIALYVASCLLLAFCLFV